MFSLLIKAALFAGVLAAPAFPLADGFPTPNPDQVKAIEQTALGTLSNKPAPASGSISADGLVNLQLINLNENFEVAYFNQLLSNVTNNASGFAIQDPLERTFVIDTLKTVIAQEELHALNAAGALKSQGKDAIQVCQYDFPVTNFQDAIALASTFTDVVLGTLQDVVGHFATNKDIGLAQAVASVIGQEGEQNGFYRVLQAKVPSALPFLTGSIRDFAFTALQGFSLPGSCPNINEIPLITFAQLNLLTTNIQAADQTLKFSFDYGTLKASTVPNAAAYENNYDWTKAGLVYINQQNTPVVEQLQGISTSGSTITFTANFPYTANEMNGLTIAAVTFNQGPFANNQAVANATLFAPAFIEINLGVR